MSHNRRTAARSARILGVSAASAALALGAAGSALACSLADFSAAALCDGGKGVITVTDKDASGVPAVVTVYLENNGSDLRQVGEQTVIGTKEGAQVQFAEEWKPGAVYRVHVTATRGTKTFVNDDIPLLTAPAKACAAEQTAKPSPSTSRSATGKPSPSASASASTPAGDDTTATASGSAAAPAPGGNEVSPAAQESNLAETGADSNTPVIAGIAAALVAVGGAAVFFGMRRRGAGNRH
ncbi:LAETG motif-containing sortase-dependent surface protein [Streptomyces longwoodensis]|uniref:LAETG motif-containing sortase-dependent surface protein n=1 Tax=Streptomyces longwoodensis TaxID=68231 RepID=UPI0033CDD0C0